ETAVIPRRSTRRLLESCAAPPRLAPARQRRGAVAVGERYRRGQAPVLDKCDVPETPPLPPVHDRRDGHFAIRHLLVVPLDHDRTRFGFGRIECSPRDGFERGVVVHLLAV